MPQGGGGVGPAEAVRPVSAAPRSSVNVMPVAESKRSKLSMVNSSVTVPPGGTGSSVNDLIRLRSVTVTSRVALAVPLDLRVGKGVPINEVSSPLTLSSMPPPVATTSTLTVHVSIPLSIAPTPTPERLKTLVPGTAVTTGVLEKVQVVDALAGEAISIPVGRLSVNASESAKSGLRELSMVKVRVLLPPSGTVDGAKLLENPGRSVATVKSTASDMLLAALELRVIAGFVWAPGVEAVTSTVTVHVSPSARSPSLRVIVPPPAEAVNMASTQFVEAIAGVPMVMATGNVSVKARSVTGNPVPLAMVNVIVETEPGPMVDGAKDLLNVGVPVLSLVSVNVHVTVSSAATMNVAVAVPVSPVLSLSSQRMLVKVHPAGTNSVEV